MDPRFESLKKIPNEPAARILALANARLKTPLAAPAAAPVGVVLDELNRKGAWIDMLRLLSAALPPRERVWWACLAGRDVVAAEGRKSPSLAAAEAWVFKPTDDTRRAVRVALDNAEPDDECTLCCTAALFADGTLGPDDMAQHTAPPGAAQAAAFGMNLIALGKLKAEVEAGAHRLVDRALDIARGGNGRVAEKSDAAADGGAP